MSEATMSETTVTMRSPVEGVGLADVPDVASLRDAGPRSRFVLRGYDLAAARLGASLGLALPLRINRAAAAGDRAAMKLGPDEWLVLTEPMLELQLGFPQGGQLTAVDISHRNAGLVLDGPKVEAVLAAGCPLPLDAHTFPVARATRTLFAKAEIVLWRRAPATFHIEVARSFAPYLAAYLGQAIDAEAALAARDGR